MITMYHIFADGRDEYTQSYEKAMSIYTSFTQGYEDVRLYQEQYENVEAYRNDVMSSEECLEAKGEFPR